MPLEWKDLTLDELKTNRPDLMETMRGTVLEEVQAEVKAVEDELAKAGQTAKPETDAANIAAKASAANPQESDQVRELRDRVDLLESERLVGTLVAASSLSETGRGMVLRRFTGAKGLKEADVKAEIDAIAAYEKSLLESVRPSGVPGPGANAGAANTLLRDTLKDIHGDRGKSEKSDKSAA